MNESLFSRDEGEVIWAGLENCIIEKCIVGSTVPSPHRIRIVSILARRLWAPYMIFSWLALRSSIKGETLLVTLHVFKLYYQLAISNCENGGIACTTRLGPLAKMKLVVYFIPIVVWNALLGTASL